MTLQQAFKGWAMSPRNMILAKNSRDAVNKVLMKRFGNVHLEQFSPELVRRIFTSSNEVQELKTKAASILVYVLSWGGDHGYCKRPNFDYTIASDDSIYREKYKKTNPQPIWELNGSSVVDEPLVKVKPEALEKRRKELAEREKKEDNSIEQKSMKETAEKKKRGGYSRQCVQIDAETLKPIKTWNSISEAERELGAKNIDRAIARKGMAKGFYWCAMGYENDFKPNKASKGQSIAEGKKKEKRAVVGQKKVISDNMKPVGITSDLQTVVLQEKIDITKCSDDEILAEIKRRGWKGNISITLNVEL